MRSLWNHVGRRIQPKPWSSHVPEQDPRQNSFHRESSLQSLRKKYSVRSGQEAGDVAEGRGGKEGNLVSSTRLSSSSFLQLPRVQGNCCSLQFEGCERLPIFLSTNRHQHLSLSLALRRMELILPPSLASLLPPLSPLTEHSQPRAHPHVRYMQVRRRLLQPSSSRLHRGSFRTPCFLRVLAQNQSSSSTFPSLSVSRNRSEPPTYQETALTGRNFRRDTTNSETNKESVLLSFLLLSPVLSRSIEQTRSFLPLPLPRPSS